MTLHMMVGCAVAILGFCLYSHAKMAAKPLAQAVVDLEAVGQKEQQSLLAALALEKCGQSPAKLARAGSGERERVRQQAGGLIKAVRFDRAA